MTFTYELLCLWTSSPRLISKDLQVSIICRHVWSLENLRPAQIWNFPSTFDFVVGWQLLVLLSGCSSFCSLYLFSATDFFFYWSDLECILFSSFVCTCLFFFYIMFLRVVFVGFLLSYKDTVFTVFLFFLIAINYHGTLCKSLGLFSMYSGLLQCGQWRSFRIHYSEQVFQNTPEEYRNNFLQLPYVYCQYVYW